MTAEVINDKKQKSRLKKRNKYINKTAPILKQEQYTYRLIITERDTR